MGSHLTKEMAVCPKCGKSYSEPPAPSREDNRTAICPSCGMMEALASIPRSKKFPGPAARLVLAWMNEQMYGDTKTQWTYGNEHDRMREAADLLANLCEETMLKRVCRYGVFQSNGRLARSVQFTVFAQSSEDLDDAMDARFNEDEENLPDGEYIDDCAWGADAPAEWNELTEEWE